METKITLAPWIHVYCSSKCLSPPTALFFIVGCPYTLCAVGGRGGGGGGGGVSLLVCRLNYFNVQLIQKSVNYKMQHKCTFSVMKTCIHHWLGPV